MQYAAAMKQSQLTEETETILKLLRRDTVYDQQYNI